MNTKVTSNFYGRWFVIVFDMVTICVLGTGFLALLASKWALIVIPAMIWTGLRAYWAFQENRHGQAKHHHEQKRRERTFQEQAGKN